MRTLTRYLALAAIAIILGSCSIAVGFLNHKKARVVASAIWHPKSTTSGTRTLRSVTTARTLSPYVAKSKVLPPRPRSAPVRSSRSVAPISSKDISAANDVDYITYTIVNLDSSSGEPAIQDYLDPYYPYIDVFLTPGQNYRITIDVALLPTSPALLAGQAVGISGYGDAAVVAVPADGSDVWVDMAVHPLGLVINNQVAIATSNMTYRDPTGGGPQTKALNTTITTVGPQDKFFYTSDSLLYYFNFAAKTVYNVTNVNSTIVTTTALAGTDISPTFQIYAICADPALAGWFYVVGEDGGTWALYVVNYDPNGVVGPTTPNWQLVDDQITPYFELQRTTPTVVVTGVAADIYGYAYVTFYNTVGVGTLPGSGMVEFDSYSSPGFSFYDQRILSDGTGSWAAGNSIITDAMYGGSNVYLLGSPSNLSSQVGGTADIFAYDVYLNQLTSNPTSISRQYPLLTTATPSGASLTMPNKFVGMIQNGDFFISQMDFAAAGGTDYLSAVSLDLSSVSALP